MVLGWALGLGSGLVLDSVKNWRSQKALVAGIVSEVAELGYRVTTMAVATTTKLKGYDHKLLAWAVPLLRAFDGPATGGALVSSLEALAKRSPEELAQVRAIDQLSRSEGHWVPSLSTPYLSAVVSELRDLSAERRLALAEIQAGVGMYNDLREQLLYWNGVTFQVGITESNHTAAVRNHTAVQMLLAQRAMLLAEKIDAFVKRRGK